MADETTLILTIFAFYAGLSVILGLVGSTFVAVDIEQAEVDGIADLSGWDLFFQGIGYSITGLPAWANFILFAPLGFVLFYILIKLLLELIPG